MASLREFLSMPMGAGPGDRLAGQTESGQPIMRTILGTEYAIKPQASAEAQRKRDVAKALLAAAQKGQPFEPAHYLATRETGGTLGDALKGAAEGVWQGVSAPGRALAGEPITMGDVMATALDYGGIAAPIGKPAGALGAGGIRAYHGSPHDFDRFSMDKIGTGEGAQAYGHGLYFAENEDVARSYRDQLSRQVTKDGKPLVSHPSDGPQGQAENSIARMVADGWSPEEAIRAEAADWRASAKEYRDISKNDPNPDVVRGGERTARSFEAIAEAIEAEDPSRYMKNPGSMYEVNINANPDDFLDWDKPLSEQPENVRKAFAQTLAQSDPLLRDLLDGSPESLQMAGLLPGSRGAQAYNTLADPARKNKVGIVAEARAAESAAQDLSAQGIPGIKYRDAGSRGAEGGTRNYVVFDDNLIEIVRKYGIAGAAAMLGVSAADVQEAMGES